MRTNKTRSILRFYGGRLSEIVFWVYLSTLTHKTRLKRLKLKIVILGIVGKMCETGLSNWGVFLSRDAFFSYFFRGFLVFFWFLSFSFYW